MMSQDDNPLDLPLSHFMPDAAVGEGFSARAGGPLAPGTTVAGRDVVIEALQSVYDPEIPVDIVELGLIYRCEVKPLGNGDREVEVDMTLTAPGCGMGDILVRDAEDKISLIPTVTGVRVQLVFDPPWNQGMMSEEARLQTGLL